MTSPLKQDWAATNTFTHTDQNTVANKVNNNTLHVITPEDFGAVGNGTTNDATALQNALNALDNRTALLIAAGKVYAHHSVLTVTTHGGKIYGGGELRATDIDNSAFRIQGNHVTVEDVKFTCPGVTIQRGVITDHKITMESSGCVLRRVTVDTSRGVGIFHYGATDFLLEDCTVLNTFFDGFHFTFTTARGVVNNCHAENTGDDAFAVDGYIGAGPNDGKPQDIVFNGFYVKNSLQRGIVASGCSNIRFYDGVIDTTNLAAINVSVDGYWKTTDTNDVVIDTVHIINANTLGSANDRGAIFFGNDRDDGHHIDRVFINNISIHNTTASASYDISINKYLSGQINNVVLGPMTFTGTHAAARLWITPGVVVKVDPSITNKPIAQSIVDTNGNIILDLPATASAVNYLRINNRTAGNSVLVETAGSDPNIGVVFALKGNSGLGMFTGAGVAARFNADGADTDVSWNFTTKGLGRVQENGNVVASWVGVPASHTATGKQGQQAADASALYICYGTNLWGKLGAAGWTISF